jgi:hypothetical protein
LFAILGRDCLLLAPVAKYEIRRFTDGGRSIPYACIPILRPTGYGPIRFQSNFFDRRVVDIFLVDIQTLSPTCSARAFMRFLLVYSL